MVMQPMLENVIRRLELYFLRENGYRLTGETYDLILFVEAGWYGHQEYNLLLSAHLLDNRSQREVIRDLLAEIRRIPSYAEFHVISGLKILKSNAQFVQDAQRTFRLRTSWSRPVVEVAGYELELGDEPSRSGLYVRSTLLEQLKAEAIVGIQFSSDGGLSNQLRVVQVSHLTREMQLVGTVVKVDHGQVRYTGERNTFSIPITHIQRLHSEADLFAPNTF